MMIFSAMTRGRVEDRVMWEKRNSIFYLLLCFSLFFFLINTMFLIIHWGYPVFYKHSLLIRHDYAVGGDFCVFYAASSLVLKGKGPDVFDSRKLTGEIEKIVGGGEFADYRWHYPPTFLLLLAPLSIMPYFSALLLWLVPPLMVYLLLLGRIAPHKLTPLLLLTFPGTLLNFISGQNGFLSAILLGGGLLVLDRRPLTGGMLLGLASYKPHLAILIPLALAAGRRWRALLGVFLAGAGLILLSLTLLGPEVWRLFFSNIAHTTAFLQEASETVLGRLQKMPTLFSAVRLMGGSNSLAWMLQGLLMLAVAAGVFWVWQRETPAPYRNAVLILSCLLFPPFIFYYDLAILALPLAWLTWEGLSREWQVGEQNLLVLGWAAPFLVFLQGAFRLRFPLIPLIIACLLIFALRASFRGTHRLDPANPSVPPS